MSDDRQSSFTRVGQHPLLGAVAVLSAALIALLSSYSVDLSPLRLTSKATAGYGFAQKQMVVDSLQSTLFNRNRDLAAISSRTETFAAILTSDRVRKELAASLRLNVADLDLSLYQSADVVGDNTDALAQLENVAKTQAKFQVQFDPQRRGPQNSLTIPVITVTVRAPTKEEARRLADATTAVAREYIDGQNVRYGVPDRSALVVAGVGRAKSATISQGLSKIRPGIVFLLVAGVGLAGIAAFDASMSGRRRRVGAAPSDAPDG